MLEKSEELFSRAKKVIPGGVNSPVRAFKSVGGTPPFIQKAQGAYLYDADGNEYIDYVLTWGPAILGHANEQVVEACKAAIDRGSSFGAPTEIEIELAELVVKRVPGVHVVRLVSSGTEACMSAVRLARGATGRHKIIKFRGCYHGHADSFLIAAGSGALTLGTPNSPGVTPGTAQDTLLASFNDIDSVQAVFEANPEQIACVILEPICGNTGCIPPSLQFLSALREVCSKNGTVLIFDEVMTGFRVSKGGAALLYGIKPDLFCFGKVLGGGFPLAGYGGSEELMRQISPDGPVYQAGTLSGNPVAVTAGIETLNQLDEAAYLHLDELGQQLEDGVQEIIDRRGLPMCQNRVGSMFGLFFAEGPVERHEDVAACDITKFNTFFHACLKRGVYLAPSQYEAGFLSLSHTPEDIDRTVAVFDEAIGEAFAT